MAKASGILAIAALFFVSLAQAQIEIPAEARIIDQAGVLSPSEIQALNTKLDYIESTAGATIEILIVPSLQGESVERFATRVQQDWHPEENVVDKHIIFLISKGDAKAHFAIGEGLQGALSDYDAESVVSEVTPTLKNGDFAKGINDAVDAVAQKIGEARVDNVAPPLHTVMIKPSTLEEAAHYVMVIAAVLILIAAFLYIGKRRDISEYLKSRSNRKRFR
jgi:uncharacterized protein